MTTAEQAAAAKHVTLRRYSWDANSTLSVTLTPVVPGSDSWWDVHLDGKVIGRVSRYTGSLDRKAGRLRIPGKSRTLWGSTSAHKEARTLHGFVSRADAIRRLLPR